MNPDEVIALVKCGFPDAQVEVEDMTGTGDHFQIFVVSAAFRGKMLIDQHRLVQRSIQSALDDGRIHAVQIKTRDAGGAAEKMKQDDFHVIE